MSVSGFCVFCPRALVISSYICPFATLHNRFDTKPTKTDILFYKLLESQPALLLRLADLNELTAIPYRFHSVELKEKAQRTDGILLPDEGAPSDEPVIVSEFQFWADPLIFTRLVSETALLHLQMPQYSRFQMVLVLRSRAIDCDAGVWTRLREGGEIHVVYLDEVTAPETLASTPEEQAAMLLMQLTVTPHNRAQDDALLAALSTTIAATKSVALQKMFKDLFVSLYLSKYKTLTIDEIRAMIDTREIFDDIHESLAVRQYGEELVSKATVKAKLEGKLEGKLESGIAMLRAGIPLEQVASILNLSPEMLQEVWDKDAS
jgi:predicted transposase/invertase (TIGR01784 family)